ncbi:hypothetical protein B2J88_44800 [Rhodococcus sp. SRB_17]|nr:hypothetical protein [Rhodococcus sp. SRB_17]
MRDIAWSDEGEYTAYLLAERRCMAWALEMLGHLDPDAAAHFAKTMYPYESADDPDRGAIFHDQAWHYAMLRVFGEGYWQKHSDRLNPSTAYDDLWAATYENSRKASRSSI